MNLWAFGESFTAGDELADFLVAYPYILGNMLKCDKVYNTAYSGASNYFITEQLMNNITRITDDDYLVFGFTSCSRHQYFSNDFNNYVTVQNAIEPFNFLRIKGTKNHTKYGIKYKIFSNVIDEFKEKEALDISINFCKNFLEELNYMTIETLIEILSVYKICKRNNFKFLLTMAFHNPFTENLSILRCKETINIMSYVIAEVQDKTLLFPEFQKFCIDNKIDLMPLGHPCEKGHLEWAKVLYNKLNEIYGVE